MCKECGCGSGSTGGAQSAAGPQHEHDHQHHSLHSHPHDHEHTHDHDHHHSHSAGHSPARREIEVRASMLDANDRIAERNRGFFEGRGILVVNVLSSPGSGKTTFLTETLKLLKNRVKAAVIVGDLATDNDARRLRESGAQAVQITTGTMCHLEASMVAEATKQLDLRGLRLLFVENVGNLVCPASYDLGERLRVVLFSVTEGEDKPLKYPPVFHSANVVVVSKADLMDPCGCDRNLIRQNVGRAAPSARVVETSARTGHGMGEWVDLLLQFLPESIVDGILDAPSRKMD